MTTSSIPKILATAYETRIWFVLLVLTCLSLIMFDRQDFPFTAGLSTHFISTTIMIVAFIKVRIVILSFMEIKEAILPLRLLFEAWVVVICCAIAYMLNFQ